MPNEQIYTAEEALPEKRVKEILDKKWKITELPTQEELNTRAKRPKKKKKRKSTKPRKIARPNVNSLKNLLQYNELTDEQKKEKLSQLRYGKTAKVEETKKEQVKEQVGEDLPPEHYLKRLEDRGYPADFIKTIVPLHYLETVEKQMYFKLVDAYIGDFLSDELTFSDIDSILELIFNRVMQMRLIKQSKGQTRATNENAKLMIDLGKQISTVKKDLSSTRSERLKRKGAGGFTILDLVAMTDESKQMKKIKKLEEMAKEDRKYEEVLESRGHQD